MKFTIILPFSVKDLTHRPTHKPTALVQRLQKEINQLWQMYRHYPGLVYVSYYNNGDVSNTCYVAFKFDELGSACHSINLQYFYTIQSCHGNRWPLLHKLQFNFYLEDQ